ncbi:TRAP transporter substrate-binding protein DctP [Thalassospira sp. HJ]|uniref:TRAP transporter substrate-binding protein DctP n=1 Tax=Thalassospira sp. HJ TaxID=1616823 RepID=UPI0009E28282|nr:TRAP transporter substrate-binding protein DctP [Thalassospira sp. HJ]
MPGRFPILLGLFLLLGMQVKAAEIQISTENTTSHFQTVVLQNYAAALNADIPAHHFDVVHSARAFNDRDVAEAVSTARVAIAAPGVWHLGQYSSDLNALLLPSLMGLGAEDVRKLVDGPVGQALDASLEEQLNVKVIGKWLDLGPAHIFTRNKPVASFDDLKGLRIRYAGGDANALRLAALGAVPVLIPWPNVSEALDRGEIDGLLTTSSTVVSASLWEHGLTHVFLSHSYYPFYVPLISGDIWKRLSETQRKAITDNWEDMIGAGRKLAVSHQESSMALLRENGIIVTAPSDQEREAVRRNLASHQRDMAREIGISDQMLDILAQHGGD